MKEKNIFVNILLIFLVIIIVVMAYLLYKIYNENVSSTKEIENLRNSITTLENIIENIKTKNEITLDNNISPEEIDTAEKTVKYEFTSADRLAVQGNPGIFKVFELTNTKIDFEYNHGWDFSEKSLHRKISGTAELNDENLYEFSENIDGYKYSLIIDFSEEMVTLSEYVDGDLLSQISLWS